MGTTAMNASSKLNSSGYVFSASLPPFLAVAAQAAIDKLDAEPQRLERLQTNARLMRRELGGMKGARVLGNDDRCPLIHLEVDHPRGENSDTFSPQQKLEQLERLVDVAIQEGVLIDVATFCSKDRSAEFSTLRVTVTAEHSDRDVRRCARVLRDVCSARL